MKQFVNFVKWLSSKVRLLLGKAEGKLAHAESKKIASPKQIKKMFAVVGLSFVSTILIITMMSKTTFVGKGLDGFKKQKGVKFCVTRADIAKKTDMIDPLERFEDKGSEENRCGELNERVLAEEKLSPDEFVIYRKCLKENIIPGLSNMQKKALETLANPDEELSEGARDLLARAASGEIDASSEEAKLVNALTSSDPYQKKLANKLLDPNTSDAEKKLLADALAGKIPREVGEAVLNGEKDKAVALNKAIKEGKTDVANKIRTDLQSSAPKEIQVSEVDDNEREAVKAALEDLEKVISDEVGKLKRFNVSGIEDKVANNKPLSNNESEILKEYQKTKSGVELLEQQKSQIYADYQKIMSKVKVNVNKDYSEFNSENPEIIEEYDPRATETPAPVVVKKEIIKKVPRITPSEYELIMAIKQKRMSDDFEGSLFPNTDPGTFAQKEILASAGSLGRMNPLKNYNLPPDLKIPAVIETEIFVSSNDAANRRVIAKVQDNVYNPETNDILMPKGAKVICTTGNFDVNTKLIQVTCSKVRVGKGTLDIGFNVVDAAGKSGIPGGVLRTRYKQITAAVLTDFASGVTEFFSRYAQQQMLQNGVNNLSLTNSTTGAAFQGLSAGLTKIAETLTQDLQNSPDIFFSPGGLKMVLTPQ